MKRETFEKLKALGIPFDADFEQLAVQPLDRFREQQRQQTKQLAIAYQWSRADDNFIYLKFKISTPNVPTGKATLYVEEVQATNETAIKTSIQLKSNQENLVEVKYAQGTTFDLFLWQDDLLFRATLSCDGLSAKTGEFKLVFVKEKQKKESFCTRDLTVDDVRNIVKVLRENTFYEVKKSGGSIKNPLTALPYYSVDKIFHRNGIGIENSEIGKELVLNSSFENFTAQLNHVFKRYDINNCNRKSHFLSQIFVETQFFTKTVESDNRYITYDPYRGRGFIHLTLIDNYKRYTEYKQNVDNQNIDFVKNYSLISTNLEYAADASGWYWKFGSVRGNINLVADKGTVKEITPYVNAASLNLRERENAFKLLKQIFK